MRAVPWKQTDTPADPAAVAAERAAALREARQRAARARWAGMSPADRRKATAPARAALAARWLDAANGDPAEAARLRREYLREAAATSHPR